MGTLKRDLKEVYRKKRNEQLQEIRDIYYWHMHIIRNGANEPRWRGVRVVKYPTDLILYAECIFQNKPDWIIETGTCYGGSALFFGDMMELVGNGQVITIDTQDRHQQSHPRVEYVIGSSSDRSLVAEVAKRVKGDSVMVVLDSDHSFQHVRRELRLLSPLVTAGQYCVVEDCYTRDANVFGPGQAVQWFLKKAKHFKLEAPENRFLLAVTRGGWLKRI